MAMLSGSGNNRTNYSNYSSSFQPVPLSLLTPEQWDLLIKFVIEGNIAPAEVYKYMPNDMTNSLKIICKNTFGKNFSELSIIDQRKAFIALKSNSKINDPFGMTKQSTLFTKKSTPKQQSVFNKLGEELKKGKKSIPSKSSKAKQRPVSKPKQTPKTPTHQESLERAINGAIQPRKFYDSLAQQIKGKIEKLTQKMFNTRFKYLTIPKQRLVLERYQTDILGLKLIKRSSTSSNVPVSYNKPLVSEPDQRIKQCRELISTKQFGEAESHLLDLIKYYEILDVEKKNKYLSQFIEANLKLGIIYHDRSKKYNSSSFKYLDQALNLIVENISNNYKLKYSVGESLLYWCSEKAKKLPGPIVKIFFPGKKLKSSILNKYMEVRDLCYKAKPLRSSFILWRNKIEKLLVQNNINHTSLVIRE